MSGGGEGLPPRPNGGDFLLQLLRRQPQHQPQAVPSIDARASVPQPQPAAEAAQNLSDDPAVAALGPTIPLPPLLPNGRDFPYHSPPWPHSPSFVPHNFFFGGFLQNPSPNPSHNWSPSPSPPLQPEFFHNHQNNLQLNQQLSGDDARKRGSLASNPRPEPAPHHDRSLVFGSLPSGIHRIDGVLESTSYNNSTSESKVGSSFLQEREIGTSQLNGFEAKLQYNRQFPSTSHEFQNQEQDRRGSRGAEWREERGRNYRSTATPREGKRQPPGFPSKPTALANWEGSHRKGSVHSMDKHKGNFGRVQQSYFPSSKGVEREERSLPERGTIRGNVAQRRLSSQLDCPVPPAGSKLHSIPATATEGYMSELHGEVAESGEKFRHKLQDEMAGDMGPADSELDDLDEQIMDLLAPEDGRQDKNDKKKCAKDYRSDTRGQNILGQRMRNLQSRIQCRYDIDRLNAPFLAIYESLVPPEEEKAKQKQLLTLLERLVSKEWPESRLHLYGSCANSFGVSRSDIDVCLEIQGPNTNKSEVLLKLAEILQSDNLQNVQALTRARVPIVKLMDPVTRISCDICINNLLGVINTKLLWDYAQVDVRLRQLAFIVKHWAKSRGVNETYQGTLSSYAYVLMCIHFLQLRKPAILPCLQGMEITYAVIVDDVNCAYFDQVGKLSGFGSSNRETIAQLVWAFFNYWAYCHDYANDVISVRTGSILSKRAKDWTRRIGNDRHLICIEDPFETSHDLGRVVDRRSIKVLREEFERAAEIMQYHPNPCVTLFEQYIPS